MDCNTFGMSSPGFSAFALTEEAFRCGFVHGIFFGRRTTLRTGTSWPLMLNTKQLASYSPKGPECPDTGYSNLGFLDVWSRKYGFG